MTRHFIALMEGYQKITTVIYDNAKVATTCSTFSYLCCNLHFDVILDVCEVDGVESTGMVYIYIYIYIYIYVYAAQNTISFID